MFVTLWNQNNCQFFAITVGQTFMPRSVRFVKNSANEWGDYVSAVQAKILPRYCKTTLNCVLCSVGFGMSLKDVILL